jgi:hypothetical protein
VAASLASGAVLASGGGPLSGGEPPESEELPESGGAPLSGAVPLSGGAPPSDGGWHGAQKPCVEPSTNTLQVSPAQQSALMLHAPQSGTHAPPA